jgi:hypothetical protein
LASIGRAAAMAAAVADSFSSAWTETGPAVMRIARGIGASLSSRLRPVNSRPGARHREDAR